MAFDIKELLALPDEEKIAIADLLYSSVNDDDSDEDETVTPWHEDEAFVAELDKEFEAWEKGESKGYTIEEVKSFMKDQKSKFRSK